MRARRRIRQRHGLPYPHRMKNTVHGHMASSSSAAGRSPGGSTASQSGPRPPMPRGRPLALAVSTRSRDSRGSADISVANPSSAMSATGPAPQPAAFGPSVRCGPDKAVGLPQPRDEMPISTILRSFRHGAVGAIAANQTISAAGTRPASAGGRRRRAVRRRCMMAPWTRAGSARTSPSRVCRWGEPLARSFSKAGAKGGDDEAAGFAEKPLGQPSGAACRHAPAGGDDGGRRPQMRRSDPGRGLPAPMPSGIEAVRGAPEMMR